MTTDSEVVGCLVRVITKFFPFTVSKTGFKCVEWEPLELIIQFCYAVAYAYTPASVCLYRSEITNTRLN
jgi:hypothetical protein